MTRVRDQGRRAPDRPLRSGPGVCLVFGLLALGYPASVVGQASPCGETTAATLRPPGSVPDTAPPPPVYYNRIEVGTAPLGVGHLRPLADGYIWDWQLRVRLPLFSEPGGSPSHWIAEGWVVPEVGPPAPLGTAGMIETGYEIVSFIVLERRSDGWLRPR